MTCSESGHRHLRVRTVLVALCCDVGNCGYGLLAVVLCSYKLCNFISIVVGVQCCAVSCNVNYESSTCFLLRCCLCAFSIRVMWVYFLCCFLSYASFKPVLMPPDAS
ncbi:hypothetical protein BU24DRAFT_231216 [Aaosphaeria arxii CBS 175.79]|uniref:Transmembrane protein n=1 Tax=Aaosphaeria arxii CBS 175.79 TaxID=1450172 RepID=A0A6A5XJT0_9PLEO|nr:uncharacterized protein BU24DRAFT_231216 [Aaosphaeria arxii CBS 175.79]KAF2013146.1 hypothetical protein BU24DRAFT_231216 [Aaosphaeria arxii CBS 175.79]